MTGSPQSHTGLLARSLGIPAVVAAPNLLTSARTGDIVIIDGAYGKIIICPSQEEVDRYRKYRADFLRWKRSLKRLRRLPSVTSDGVYVSLKGNIDLPTEVEILVQTGVDEAGKAIMELPAGSPIATFLSLLPLISTILIVAGNLFVGQLIERTKTRAGKARPWML